MAADDNKRLVARYFETVDRGDEERTLELIDQIVAEDYVAYWAGATYRGRDALKAHVSGAYETFDELRHEIEQNLADGNTVVTRVTLRAKVKGEFLGIPAAGKRIECPIIYITKFSDGRIAEMWLDWDALFTVAERLRAP